MSYGRSQHRLFFTGEKLLRLADIIKPFGPIPLRKSAWWSGIKSGRFPAPSYVLGNRLPTWRSEDIRKLIEEGVPRAGLAAKEGGRR
jgi:hypothetical protein